jgi:hypothetical protein
MSALSSKTSDRGLLPRPAAGGRFRAASASEAVMLAEFAKVASRFCDKTLPKQRPLSGLAFAGPPRYARLDFLVLAAADKARHVGLALVLCFEEGLVVAGGVQRLVVVAGVGDIVAFDIR